MKRKRQTGQAVIEVSLMSPWIFLLFVATFDVGFSLYAMICTENAARVGAAYASSSSAFAADAGGACRAALGELNTLPNVGSVHDCGTLPVIVTASRVMGPDGAPASSVAVTYQTINLIPVPGIPSQLTITRTVQMRLP